MNRRDAITQIGGLVAGVITNLAPTRSMAQSTRPIRVGVVSVLPPTAGQYVAFLARMAEFGYEEGRNLTFEFEQANGFEGYGEAYREVAARGVDILLGIGPEIALKSTIAVAGEIPIVMIAVDYHPIEKGYVQSLAKPGGNITGLFFQQLALTKKRLQLLQEVVPDLKGTTIFWDSISADQWQSAQVSAAELGLPIKGIELRDEPYDFEQALANVPQIYRGALSVRASPIFALPERRRLPDFALRNRLPAIFINRAYVSLGGLMSYGPSFATMYRRAADYVDQISNGATPADMPIEQPTKFELIINLRTADALGISVPQSILLRADEVIE